MFDLVIFFCLYTKYWNSWAFLFLLINVLDVFNEKQIFNKDIMLTNLKCFPGLLWLLWIDVKSANDANIDENYIEDANARSIFTKAIYNENTYKRDICRKNIYIRNIYFRGANIGIICIKNIHNSNLGVKL